MSTHCIIVLQKNTRRHLRMLELQPIEYNEKMLERKRRSKITEVVGINQKIILRDNVIDSWKAKEELEGMVSLELTFHKAVKTHNFLYGASHYQVQKNAAGNPVLVRVSE